MKSTRLLPFLAVLLLLPRSSPAAPSVARRQLDLAREQIGRAEFLPALASAESALRAEPELVEAGFVKALAYEGIGRPRLAALLLEALAAGDPDLAGRLGVSQALARVRRAADGTPADSPPSPEERAAFVTADDPEPWRERARAALDAGGCADAAAAAAELAWWRPEDPAAWVLAGRAASCAGDARSAVLAFRRHLQMAGEDAEVARLLASMETNLASLAVTVRLDPRASGAVVLLDIPGEKLQAATGAGPADVLFADLPIGVPVEVTVAGRGLAATRQDVAALAPGERRTVEVAPAWTGLGTVRVAEYPARGIDVSLRTAAGPIAVAPGGTFELTAGPVTATVTTEAGTREVDIVVPDGGTIDFDPLPYRAAALTVVDLPAGSGVRVFIEAAGGGDAEQALSIPVEVGAIEPESGVRLAPPRKLGSLPGGAGTLFVEHPVLGSARTQVALMTGESNAITFAWKAMEGVPTVRARYEQWKARRAIAESGLVRARTLAVVSAVLAGVGSALVAGGVAAGRDAEALRAGLDQRYEDPAADGWCHGSDTALAACQDDQGRVDDLLASRRGLVVGGVASAGVGALGFGITVGIGASTRASIAEVGPWEPSAR